MKLTKKIEYEITTNVKDVGDIIGNIRISDSFNFTENAIKYPIGLAHLGAVIDHLELDYNAVPGLDEYKGKLSGMFLLPNTVPTEKRGWKFKKSKNYDACIKEIYNVLAKIVDKEYEGFKSA